MSDLAATLRVLEPYPGIFTYYDGRIDGKRLHSEGPNWLDDGAFSLGTASYAIVDGAEALVYDTHMSLDHARAIRAHLTGRGVTQIRVVLSHWHNDHVAGNAVFADCEIIALRLTADLLQSHRDELATQPPAISPLVMPNRLFEHELHLTVGQRQVELHHFQIHSADGNVMWLPDQHILLAGDTVEDTVTYICEPEEAGRHLRELDRLGHWPIDRILPNHGDLDRIAAGGYDQSLIGATKAYLRRLLDVRGTGEELLSLREFVAPELASGAIIYFAPYEVVHAQNMSLLRAATLKE
ncbi:MBL fold metallo-hydrolase [Methylovirgula sp. 4M-Z18]|uniref:MBL fold metallo-hydrolase n=1 Tax=Methylovirgula sp. 4M-Z18 TaxID=2293567 RepID=UPI000E2F78E9|nr:MBL fold metallo-hydrolase [Methylovirgula sp. 4M-Z18]RFB80234.1 MBL fold metallo-hydrolase [Methylovirgula sp. 4M-Z18]